MTIAQITLIESAKGFLELAIINDLTGKKLIKVLDDAINRIKLAEIQKTK